MSNDENPSFCDLNRANNVWVEGVVDIPAGKLGICMLDSMSEAQIIHLLQHNPQSRRDLPKVTSNPEILALLDSVPLLSGNNPYDKLQSQTNTRGNPFYTVFQGKPPPPKVR